MCFTATRLVEIAIMTKAICFNCGTEKFGAFTQCAVCKATPSSQEQLEVSMALCEHMHSSKQLAIFAEDIREHRKLVFGPGILDQAREALKDPQLVSMLGLVIKSSTQESQRPASPQPRPSSAQCASHIKVRRDAPDSTDLHKTAFAILDVTTRDNRRRIVEQAEERSLSMDHELCTKARSDLTIPRNRLSVEVAWLPGISPKRASAYCTLIKHDLDKYMSSAEDESPLVKSNLIAAALDLFDADMDADDWASWIYQLASEADQIEAENVYRLINEDRSVAGFPLVSGPELVEEEVSNRRRYYKESIKNAIDRLPTKRMIDVMTDVVDTATLSGEDAAPLLIDELIDSYELGVRSFLEREANNVEKLIESIRDSAAGGVKTVMPLVDKLDSVIRNWDRVAQPIQLSMKSRGLEHRQSRQIALTVRDLGIDLFNHHQMLDQAERITHLLKDVFAELPEVVNRLEEDSEAIANLHKDRAKAQKRADEWVNEITFEAQIGLVFKDTLKISPNGVEWKGSRVALDNVTGIGWGATRNSVNGVPTGTDYFIYWCGASNVTSVQLNRENVYSTFIDKLWKSVGVRLMTEMVGGLRDGKRYRFGDAILDDYGMELTKSHLFSADEKIKATWAELQFWNANGSFYIGKTNDKKAVLALPYQGANNAHVLEAAIRMKFKTGNPRLSSILDD